MAGHGLGAAHSKLVCVRTKHRLDRSHFRYIPDLGGGAVGIDVVNLLRLQTRVTDSVDHGPAGTLATGGWRRDVISIIAHAKTDHLAIDGGSASPSMLQLFQHDHPGTVTQYETITAFIPGTAGFFRLIVTGR